MQGNGGGGEFQCASSEGGHILSARDFQSCTAPPRAVNNDLFLVGLQDFPKKVLQTDVDLSKKEKNKIGRMIHHDYIDS